MIVKSKATMIPGEILAMALEKEKEAHRFYEDALNHSHSDVMRELLAQLKDEEYRHIRLIESKITDLNLGRM
jgi:rubrerythrin